MIVLCVLATLPSCRSMFDAMQNVSEPGLYEEKSVTDLSPRGPRRIKTDAIDGNFTGQSNREYEFYHKKKRLKRARSPAPPGVNRSGNGFRLSFEKADLEDVVKIILGDTLQESYIYDPRVQGQVTMSTGKPVTRSELISVLEAILQMNSGALTKQGDQYRILPRAEAESSHANLSIVQRGEFQQPGYGVSILPLRNISATAMMRLLQNFLTRADTLRAETTTNLLLIRGTASERTSVIDIAATFDVDWLRGQSAGIFPLTHSTPDEIIDELKNVFDTQNNGLGKGLVRFKPLTRLNAILVLTNQEHLLEKTAEWVRRLDRANSSGFNLYIYQVENGKAVDLAAVLSDVFSSGDGAPKRRSAKSQVSPNRRAVRLNSTPTGENTTQGLQQPRRKRVSRTTRTSRSTRRGGSSVTGQTRITADEINNSLLIRATLPEYLKIKSVLRQIDKPPLQVLINATIAEVTLNNTLRYGVQVFLKGSDLGLGKNSGSIGLSSGTEAVLKQTFPGLNFLLGSSTEPRLVLDALSEVTDVKVVSSPSLVVIDNQTATLQVGDEVPITTRQSTSVTDPEAPVVNNIQFRDTGVILRVTPRVNSSGLVTMEIEQEISNVVETSEGGTLTPTISQRKIASTIAVYSNQTVVLGGLISERKNRLKNGVPGFYNIPVLGNLLGRTKNTGKRTELIVFIRPEVIRDGYDASRVANELRSRLLSMAPVREYGEDGTGSKWRTRSLAR